MKTLHVILLVTLILSCYGQESTNRTKNKAPKEINEILKKDTLSYHQYLMSKRCFCMENYNSNYSLKNMKSIKKYTHHKLDSVFYDMKKIGYLYYIVVDEDKLVNSFENKILDQIVEGRSISDIDWFRIDNSFILCEKISYPNVDNYKEYLNFINDLNNYTRKENYVTGYSDSTSYIDEILKYYPGKKDQWNKIYSTDEIDVSPK